MKKWLIYLLLAMSPYHLSLQAEIEKIELSWNNLRCLDVCLPSLENNLKNVPGVSQVQLTSGMGKLQWSSNAPFSFYPLNLAARTTGLRFTDVRMKVKGLLSHDSDHFYLTSLGDGTKFQLIGLIQAQPNQYVIKSNIASYPITSALKQQLLEAENKRVVVSVEGALFQPYRYNLILIIEQLQILSPQSTTNGPKPTINRSLRP